MLRETSPPTGSAPSLSLPNPELVPVDIPSPLTIADAPPSSRVSQEVDEVAVRQPFYVEVPLLPTEVKKQYSTDVLERLSALEDEVENELVSVVGEYEENGQLYYFAKYPDGIAHKFPAELFKARHPELLDAYKQQKEAETLPPFDPSALYVHPRSRVRMTIKLNRQFVTKRRSTRSRSSSDELAMTISSDSDFEAFDHPGLRRSTRAVASRANRKVVMQLPFSPKKTRSRKAPDVHDSDFASDSDVVERPRPRRSMRASRQARSNLDDDDFEDDFEEISTDSFVSDEPSAKRKPAPTKKKIVRGKASRPAYGRIRVVADLELDAEEDEETAPLRAHRDICEKCHRQPTHELLALASKKKNNKRRKKMTDDEDDGEDEVTRLAALGGWVRCLKCPVAAHWSCLAKTQRDEILKAALERDRGEWQLAQAKFDKQAGDNATRKKVLLEPKRRPDLDAYQTTEFICGQCMKGGICTMCEQVAIYPDTHIKDKPQASATTVTSVQKTDDGEVEMTDATDPSSSIVVANKNDVDEDSPFNALVFRCFTCKRLTHYEHLPAPPGIGKSMSTVDLAEYYQEETHWQCEECASLIYSVEHILAWRPYRQNAIDTPPPAGEPVNYKAMLPRDYLVKWVDRSYRRTTWVPHGWLLATHPAKLKNFLQGGSKVQLLPEPITEENATSPDDAIAANFEIGSEDVTEPVGRPDTNQASALLPNPDAERKIPRPWETVDRVLDVLLWYPDKRSRSRKRKASARGRGRRSARIASSEDDSNGEDPEITKANQDFETAYNEGEQPSHDLTETVDEYESRTGELLSAQDADRVIWGFFKWGDLGYENATWDSPPRKGDRGWTAFEIAFSRFLVALQVVVNKKTKKEWMEYDDRPLNSWREKNALKYESQPQLGQKPQLKLMPFQIDGFNWLVDNWWNHQNCILADEMGLGKTVQVATFIGYLALQRKAFPALIVVPNSTISNWMREFERWAPKLRVVPFYGEIKAREIIKRYELFHHDPAENTTGIKYHVLVTTYEMITNPKEFTPIFKNVPRWEVLVVDEGQRLKSDESLIFKKLKDLKTVHRVIMTGTPLNNNIRELFNLMNFLDPGEWSDLDALSKQFEELSEEKIKELHTKLKPYFLRRMKSEVLQLPPKNEVIVPVSMAPLQKEVYRSLLSQNLNILRNLVAGSMGAKVNAAISKANMNNILMQLRKCLQHPYLVSDEIEPKGLSRAESHAKLIDASAKLGLLKMLLPKLRQRGHRVLLFSQFSIALNVIEDFLVGEGMKYLRLDGSTKQADRQKGMDEFNKPDSDIFIYLLTTRAGGVGINLWTADTVIIFDPDFNPHQDLQAIARAHRYGQEKTCLVFKLMVKGSAEDKIMQTGKKKLVLDHLIVQKMDDADGSKEDVQSILMFGAQALFDESENAENRQIHYSEHDIENLVEKTEKKGDESEAQTSTAGAFSFAKVWSAEKDSFSEIGDEPQDGVDQVDSWAQTLERIAAERVKVQVQEVTGRGVRRRAAAVFPAQNVVLDDGREEGPNTPQQKKRRRKKLNSAKSDDSDAYALSGLETGSDSEATTTSLLPEETLSQLPLASSSAAPGSKVPCSKSSSYAVSYSEARVASKNKTIQPLSPIIDKEDASCGLCGANHGDAPCYMTQSPENLAEYRLMLLLHAGEESLEDRRAAIQAIDQSLYKRGKMYLIYNQPLHLVEHPSKVADLSNEKHKKEKPTTSTSISSHNDQASSSSASRKEEAQTSDFRANGTHVIVGSSTAGPQPVPRPSYWKATAGPAKRASSPTPVAGLPPKRTKLKTDAACAVCGRSPHHLIKDCPIVAEGPNRVKQAIRCIAADPTQAGTVNILRNILAKQQKRDLADISSAVVIRQ
ncbi:uncharacterized protein LAESUDRAFT_661821 [Laetiporus sulphureus 93-53]|uniref:Chromatin remodeling factor mit1 n=1 Tax=Laetiporus sulphureus 93-53 TaxID=1314785 RepID=A0A165C8V3_9APHY|nr:uncharacterized protein LAESUDRAFT_661821 [Laetiporus sulphureus 93-53]KZT02402.1 hypothetical protein LAESUDRAFT_661821 [Laetiporus sulphureus 93-53]